MTRTAPSRRRRAARRWEGNRYPTAVATRSAATTPQSPLRVLQAARMPVAAAALRVLPYMLEPPGSAVPREEAEAAVQAWVPRVPLATAREAPAGAHRAFTSHVAPASRGVTVARLQPGGPCTEVRSRLLLTLVEACVGKAECPRAFAA